MSDKLLMILFLQQLKGFGPVKINSKCGKFLRKANDLDELAFAVKDGNTFAQIPGAKASAIRLYDSIMADDAVTAITTFDPEYPASFQSLGDKKPPVIFVKGDLTLLSKPAIAIVGTRHPSAVTIAKTREIAESIAEKGIAVVSGLAEGCDTLAHLGAIDQPGRTVAVLPSGFNKIYPKQNTALASKIAETGCLVSEYAPDTSSSKFTFVRRDALIAALGKKTIVMECAVSSGTMHTADAAYEMHRPVGCFFPDSMDESFAGNEHIVKTMSGIRISNDSDVDAFCEKVLQ